MKSDVLQDFERSQPQGGHRAKDIEKLQSLFPCLGLRYRGVERRFVVFVRAEILLVQAKREEEKGEMPTIDKWLQKLDGIRPSEVRGTDSAP